MNSSVCMRSRPAGHFKPHISSRAMPPLPTTTTRRECRSRAASRATLSVSRIVSTRCCSAATSASCCACCAASPGPARAADAWNTLGGSCLGRAPAQMHSLSYGRRSPLPSSRACLQVGRARVGPTLGAQVLRAGRDATGLLGHGWVARALPLAQTLVLWNAQRKAKDPAVPCPLYQCLPPHPARREEKGQVRGACMGTLLQRSLGYAMFACKRQPCTLGRCLPTHAAPPAPHTQLACTRRRLG